MSHIILDVSANPESRQFNLDLKKADGFLLMYDLLSQESLNEVPRLWKMIRKAKGAKDFPCILIGNKVDMKSERLVTYEAGRTMSEELKIGFVEASTTIPINVKFAATSLVQKIIKLKEQHHREQKQISAHSEHPPKKHSTPHVGRKKASNCHIS
jgi:GTPase SAR1 family protein